jgi:hypothetical protein
MAEDKDALVQHYRQAHADVLAAIDGLSDEQMTETSLDGWSVKDHLAHLADWDDIRASEVVRISAGHDSAWPMTGHQGDIYNMLSYDLRRTLPLAQVKWELATSIERLLGALSAATERGLDPVRYAEAPLRSVHSTEHAGWIRRWRREKGI